MPEFASGVRLSGLYDRGDMRPIVEVLCPPPAYAAFISGEAEVLCICEQRTSVVCRCTADP